MMISKPPTHQSPSVQEATGDARSAEPSPEPTIEVGQRRIAMLLPAELLQGGETIILLLKPSPWYILLEPLRFVLTTLFIMAACLWLYKQGYYLPIDRRDLVLLGSGVLAARLFWQFLEWLSRVYVLTDRRVIRVRGVLRVQVFEAQLKVVQHTQTVFSLRERPFGLGTIQFATAGTGLPEARWRMINRPLEVHQTVVKALNRYR